MSFALKALAAASLFAAAGTAVAVDMDKEENRFGYSLGFNVGQGFSNDFPNMDLEAFKQGLDAAVKGDKASLSEADMRAAIQSGQKKAQAARKLVQAKLGEKNKAAGAKFLADNAKQDGVQTTASGLQYSVLAQGEGKSPKATDTVSVHYHGTLPDGTVFDSSVERGTPAVFPLDRVIPGWTEGLQLMQEGAKYRFFVPENLAYGARPPSPSIGPHQVLIFDVELLEVKG